MASSSSHKSVFSLVIGTLAAASAACQGEPSGTFEDPICLTDSCEAEPSPPISGNAIVDCWVTEAGQPGGDLRFDVLDCRYQPPANYPASLVGATVTGLSGSGDLFSADIERQEVGQVVSMAHIDPSAYPIELQLDIRFDPNDHTIAALEGLDKVTTKIMVQSAADIASDRPASAHIPFDLWEVNLLGRTTDFSALSFGYSVDAGAGRSHDVAFKTRPLLFGRTERLYLPVGPDTFSVDARLAFSSGAAGTASVTGPGTYAVTDGLFQRATDVDLPQLGEAGSPLANCWFDLGEHGFESLFCQGKERRGIELAGAMIEVNTVNGKTARTPVGSSPTLIATVSPEAFPLSISIVASVSTDVVGLQTLAGRSLRATMEISGKLIPRDVSRRAILAPFSVWEATIDNRSEGFQGSLDAYVLELGAGMNDRFASFVDDAETPFVEQSSIQSFLVASPAGLFEMNGSGFVLVGGQAQDLDFVLTPGTLIVGE